MSDMKRRKFIALLGGAAVLLQFRGSVVTSDAGLLAYRELSTQSA
jgi:hypothetical protein